jgi:hypothetical protein
LTLPPSFAYNLGMANEEYVKILKQEVEQWNTWRAEIPEIQPDLSRPDLKADKKKAE